MAYMDHEIRVKELLVIVKSGVQTKDLRMDPYAFPDDKYLCPIGTLTHRA